MQLKYKARSFREETTLSFFLIIFLPLLLFHIIFSFFSADILDAAMKKMATVSFQRKVAQFEKIIDRNDHISQTIMFQHEIQEILYEQETTTPQLLANAIKKYSVSHQLKEIDFYDRNGMFLYTSRLDQSMVPLRVEDAVKNSYGESMLATIKPDVLQSNELRFWRKIKVIYPSISDNMSTIGYLAASYSFDELYHNTAAITNNEQFAIMEKGQSLYEYPSSRLPNIFTEGITTNSAEFRKTPEGKSYYMLTQSLAGSGKIAVSIIPADNFSQDIFTLFSTTLNILFAFCVAAFLVSHIFSSYISRPIRKLIENILALDTTDINDEELFYPHELNELTYAFNKMALKIKEVYELENAKSLAELQALQAQINPHFMYNTFEAIRWMNKGGETEKVEEMISLLSNLFRFGINVEKNIITLGEEIEHAEAYLGIQRMRYGDELQYSLDVSPETLQCLIPKLILQPLLENSIHHGIRELENRQGRLQIECKKHGDTLQMMVTDNGKGFSKQKKEHFEYLAHNSVRVVGEHVGLINVYRRLEHIYQDGFSFSIDSTPEVGTRITITIPYRLQETNFTNDVL